MIETRLIVNKVKHLKGVDLHTQNSKSNLINSIQFNSVQFNLIQFNSVQFNFNIQSDDRQMHKFSLFILLVFNLTKFRINIQRAGCHGNTAWHINSAKYDRHQSNIKTNEYLLHFPFSCSHDHFFH